MGKPSCVGQNDYLTRNAMVHSSLFFELCSLAEKLSVGLSPQAWSAHPLAIPSDISICVRCLPSPPSPKPSSPNSLEIPRRSESFTSPSCVLLSAPRLELASSRSSAMRCQATAVDAFYSDATSFSGLSHTID